MPTLWASYNSTGLFRIEYQEVKEKEVLSQLERKVLSLLTLSEKIKHNRDFGIRGHYVFPNQEESICPPVIVEIPGPLGSLSTNRSSALSLKFGTIEILKKLSFKMLVLSLDYLSLPLNYLSLQSPTIKSSMLFQLKLFNWLYIGEEARLFTGWA